jgi:hypothetical protein
VVANGRGRAPGRVQGRSVAFSGGMMMEALACLGEMWWVGGSRRGWRRVSEVEMCWKGVGMKRLGGSYAVFVVAVAIMD